MDELQESPYFNEVPQNVEANITQTLLELKQEQIVVKKRKEALMRSNSM